MIQLFLKGTMSKPEVKKTSVSYTYDAEIKNIKSANFMRETCIFLNYMNKITNQHAELTIKGNWLFIFDKEKKYTNLVPLSNISSIELE